MLLNDETASDVVRDGPTTDSVYDFIYHDARRIGSFLGQLDVSGHLTGLKQTETAESTSVRKGTVNASASIGLARGGAGYDGQNTKGDRETFERTYDPLWTNALTLLDMLSERGMIHDGLEGARIGQFVKVSGSLGVTDLTLWKGLWSLPSLKQVLAQNAAEERQASLTLTVQTTQNRHERRKDKASRPALELSNGLRPQMESALALVGMLPHTIQARLNPGDGTSAWCSLREDGLVVSASDLTLKHGATVSGRWTMVGVLDAFPERDVNGNLIEMALEDGGVASDSGAGPFGNLMAALTPVIRGLLGRPDQAHGITPLVIFREVTV